MRIGIICFALLMGLTSTRAQKLEHFDLVLFSLNKQSDSSWRASAPRFISGFNPRGYNNQPQFFSPYDLYLTVQTLDDTTQTEIYNLNPALRTTTRVTATTTAEYSPTLMPGGKYFSAVRVEGNGSQRLWAFPLDRSDNGRPVFPNITGVGYHCWLHDTLAALFIVGENNNSHYLALAGTGRQQLQRIAFNVGRCLQKMPDGRLAFIQKATEQTWFIKTYDLKKKTTDILVKTLPGSEDFALLPDGTLLSGQGAKLYQYNPRRQTDWKEVADLGRYGVKNITRMAVSPDGKLAIVVQ